MAEQHYGHCKTHLLTHVQPAHSQDHPQCRLPRLRKSLCIVAHHVVRLPRQLPGRAQDKPIRALARHEGHFALLLQHKVHERERERKRLPRAREGDADHVTPGQRHGNACAVTVRYCTHVASNQPLLVSTGDHKTHRTTTLHLYGRGSGDATLL